MSAEFSPPLDRSLEENLIPTAAELTKLAQQRERLGKLLRRRKYQIPGISSNFYREPHDDGVVTTLASLYPINQTLDVGRINGIYMEKKYLRGLISRWTLTALLVSFFPEGKESSTYEITNQGHVVKKADTAEGAEVYPVSMWEGLQVFLLLSSSEEILNTSPDKPSPKK